MQIDSVIGLNHKSDAGFNPKHINMWIKDNCFHRHNPTIIPKSLSEPKVLWGSKKLIFSLWYFKNLFFFLGNARKILPIKNQCDLYDLFVLLIYLYNTYSQKKDRWPIFKETIRRVHGVLLQHATRCFSLFVIKLNTYVTKYISCYSYFLA